MSTPKPGQIRCPTCHESTPPAAFCTRCGQPIPASALARPRGLDRQELEERLRTRRPGDAPYRRGSTAAEGAAVAGFDRFEPEPEDALAVREAPDAREGAPRVDNLQAEQLGEPPDAERPPARWPREAPRQADADAWPESDGGSGAPPEEPRYEPAADDRPDRDAYREPAYVPPEVDDEYYDYGTDYDYDAEPQYEQGSGGPWLIVGIIGLGLVALLGGVLLAGLFSDRSGVARETPTPTIAAEASPTPTDAQQTPTPGASSEATPGPPGTFPDGFTASVQPCATEEITKDGCVEEGSTLSGSTVWVWARFKNGQPDDVIGVSLVDAASGDELQDESLELSTIGCKPDQVCPGGYMTFSFGGFGPGDYLLRVSRNGTFAAEAPFTAGG